MAPPDPHHTFKPLGGVPPQQPAAQVPPPQPPQSPTVTWRSPGGLVRPPSFTPAPTRRSVFIGAGVPCENCGDSMRGRYCSTCGHQLPESDSLGTLVYEHLIEERLNDLFCFLKTLWFIIVCPTHFFRGVLVHRSLLPKDRFFLSGLWRKVSHKAQDVADPLRFVAIACGILLLMRLTGLIHDEATSDPGTHLSVLERLFTSDIVKHELEVALIVLGVTIYSFALSVILGERISTNDITRYFLYLNGIVLLVSEIATAYFDKITTGWLIVGVTLYLLVVTYVVLPRLYSVSRKRLLASQFGSFLLVFGAVALVAVFVEAFNQGTAS